MHRSLVHGSKSPHLIFCQERKVQQDLDWFRVSGHDHEL